MTNQQARMIASGLAMVAGALYSTVTDVAAEAVGGFVFYFAGIFLAVEWIRSCKGEKP